MHEAKPHERLGAKELKDLKKVIF